jgi:cobalt-zinc-cadmium efflux system outer membrane protein
LDLKGYSIAVVWIVALVGRSLFAQTTLTPESAVQIALEQHPFLTAAESRIAAAEGLRMQAGLKPNPRLYLQSENTRFGGSTPFRFAHETDNFAYASQGFEGGGKRARRVEFALENTRTREAERVMLRRQTAARVLSAYWAVVGAQQLEASMVESLGNLEKSVQYHRDRVQQGSLPEADLIRVQLEYQQVAISVDNARQEAKRLLLSLFKEMGTPEQPNVQLLGELAAVPNLIIDDIEEAIERRPDVQIARQSILQARANVRLQSANATPDPEVLFGYKRTAGLDTVVAGVQVNLPVRNRNQGGIASAAAEERAASATLQGVLVAARTEIVAAIEEYQQKQRIVSQMLPTLRSQAMETSRIAQAVYREGASDLLRLLDAERTRLQAEGLYIRTLTEYRQSAVYLQTAAGLLP